MKSKFIILHTLITQKSKYKNRNNVVSVFTYRKVTYHCKKDNFSVSCCRCQYNFVTRKSFLHCTTKLLIIYLKIGFDKALKQNMYTVFDLISARGAYGNLLSFTSAKRLSSGR